jgi:tRNA dimethylallyltransferase
MKTIVVFGPTASGKSALAVALAQALGGEVVNADSRQIYKEIPIVTACPNAADYAAVPHHLFEYVNVTETYSAGRYALEAAEKIDEIKSRGAVPVVVGGTGFYLKSLLQPGSANAPQVPQKVLESVQERLKTSQLEALVTALRARDPEAAAVMDLRNPQRVVRALAVMEATGQKFSSFKNEGEVSGDYICVALNPPVEELNARIELRWKQMQDAGVVEEVERVREKFLAEAPGLQSVGVREIGAFLDGGLSWKEAEAQYLAAMRQYAKRQRTWLRNSYKAEVGFEGVGNVAGMVSAIKSLL